jgi:type VI secretion system secreted protein VgrG
MATVPFQLMVDGVGSLRVHSLHGKEALSAAWHFDIVASGASGEEAERVALGQRATLISDLGDKTRAFYGVVAAVKVDEVHAIDREVKYVFRIVPRLWLLKRNRKTRIFQNKRITDIVNAVLLESNIAVRWSLVRPCPRRDYCTQYEESDYDFVRRILAEAGIYFYFFSGPPIPGSAFEVNLATGLAAQVGGAAVGMAAGSAAGGLAGSAISMAETLVPGDTIVCADDALCYPSVAGDDPAMLAASTVASLSASAADLVSGASLAGAAIAGAVSAVAGSVIAALGASGTLGVTFMPNEQSATSTYDKVTRFGLRNTPSARLEGPFGTTIPSGPSSGCRASRSRPRRSPPRRWRSPPSQALSPRTP